jgi:hypothetical protein
MTETKESILAKLKETYHKFFGEETPQKFAEVKTADGNTLFIDGESAAAGVPVMITDAEGAKSPAPDGEYKLEDGTVIAVKEGMITAVGKVEDTEEDMDETKLSKLEKAIKKLDIQKQVEEHKSAIAELKESQKSLKMSEEKEAEYAAKFEAQAKDIADIKDVNKQLFALVEKVLELPSEESRSNKKKDGFAKQSSVKEQLNAYRMDLRNLQNN